MVHYDPVSAVKILYAVMLCTSNDITEQESSWLFQNNGNWAKG